MSCAGAWCVVQVQVTDAKTGETLLNFDFAKGTATLADRGYCHRRGLAHLIDQGAQPIVRLNPHHVPLGDRAGAVLDLAAALQDCAPGDTRTLAAQFTAPNEKTYPVYVHAYRLQGAAAEAARRRCRRGAQKAGKKRKYTPSQQSLFLAEFVLVLTTIEPSVLSAETVLALYRCRWQIELVFKHFKSLLEMDAVRARHGSVLGQVWLQGKLLYAALLMRRAERYCGTQWQRLDQARDGTWWRVWKLVKQELAPLISLAACWHPADWPKALKALKERRRKRQLQRVPQAVAVWLEQPA